MGGGSARPTWLVALIVTVGAMCSTAACSPDGDDTAATTSSSTTTRRAAGTTVAAPSPTLHSYPVPDGAAPHDVWALADGTIWYSAQAAGALGVLDSATGAVRHIPLGRGSRPHGVIEGPDGAAWVTDGGLNAIVRVEPSTDEVRRYVLPANRPNANLNTAAFDAHGTLWFTGQAGVYGRLRVGADAVEVFDAPDGRGPYGITATADAVYYASLAGSYVGRIDPTSGAATVLHPPTPGQGTRRVWADSKGRIWSSQWNTGQVAVLDPSDGSWHEWSLPGPSPRAYAVYVDDRGIVWLSDFGANAIVSFDPTTEAFTSFPLPSKPGDVRQLHGRRGEVWGAESAADRIVVIRTSGSGG